MTKLRASLVCEMSLASSAREIGLGQYLFLGKGEKMTGGAKRDSILSDAFEAVLGAIYLDGGFEPAKEFVRTICYVRYREKSSCFTTVRQYCRNWFRAIRRQTVTFPIRLKKKADRITTSILWFGAVSTENCMEAARDIQKSSRAGAAYETILMLRQEK